MGWDRLPVELRLKIASELDISDVSSLSRVSRSWRNFIKQHASRLPKHQISSLQIEEHDYRRFKFLARVLKILPDEMTRIKRFFFRTESDLWLFLQLVDVHDSLFIGFSSNISLGDSICRACRNVNKLSVNVCSRRGEGQKLNAQYLTQICDGLPKLNWLCIEDISNDFDEDVHQIVTKIKKPVSIEVHSNKPNSKLRINDETLEHLTSFDKPIDMDVVALSTTKSKFSLKAVREFLENCSFLENGYIELYHIDCTTNDFFNLLSEINIPFSSDPVRSIFNSFPIVLRGKHVSLNIKHFSDSNSLRG